MRTALLLGALLACSLPAQDQRPLSPDQKILQALSRLTYGHRPGDVERVRKLGLDAWIAAQLAPEKIDDGALDKRLAPLKTLGMSPKASAAWMMGQANNRRSRRQITAELRQSLVLRARYSERQLAEVLADFWRNHFNVDVNKDSVEQTATHYEYGVLRPHMLGSFKDLLLETARHPAMLVYLDNYLSRRRPGKAELNALKVRIRQQTGSKERARQRAAIAEQTGLNENYARELMELHTLGVDNGYTQKDVVEVARAFTGWTVDREAGDTWFRYREDMHEKGRKTFLGKNLPVGRRESGIIEGESVLKRLASHKNTSEFISRKLCQRLVDDSPSDRMVQDVAKVFRRTRGDLRAVTRAVVTHPEFFSPRHFQSKFKTPLEFVVSALRATDTQVEDPRRALEAIAELGQPLYACEDPTGYSDSTEAWRDPGVMAFRWRFAIRLAAGSIKSLQIPESFYAGLPDDLLALPDALALRIIPEGVGQRTRKVLERELFRQVQKAGSPARLDRRTILQRFTGILLGSPEFQQQ